MPTIVAVEELSEFFFHQMCFFQYRLYTRISGIVFVLTSTFNVKYLLKKLVKLVQVLWLHFMIEIIQNQTFS